MGGARRSLLSSILAQKKKTEDQTVTDGELVLEVRTVNDAVQYVTECELVTFCIEVYQTSVDWTFALSASLHLLLDML